ncbi:MAG: hypothetical protein D4S01_07370 [Dehalococcoidia bacterium]|nr:MAG: hypothetical protein D4S01_07370 [Dehalococcoidia bacterium]
MSTVWLLGFMITVGIGWANAKHIKDAGFEAWWVIALLVAAAYMVWPVILGWAIGRGLRVTVNPHDAPSCSCGCKSTATQDTEEDVAVSRAWNCPPGGTADIAGFGGA